MKHILLSFVVALGLLSISVTPQAQAAGCFANLPDSAWGPQNPRGNSGQPQAVLSELRGPTGSGSQTLALRKVEIVLNQFTIESNVDLKLNNPEPSVIEEILRGELVLFTPKDDYQANSNKVNIRFVYSGLNCDERIVTVPGSIRFEYKSNLIPYTDSKKIMETMLSIYPAYNFLSAQADYDGVFAPFFQQFSSSESNPIRVTNSNFRFSSQVFTAFGPGGNGSTGYFVLSNDGCVTSLTNSTNTYRSFNGFNQAFNSFPIPLPEYFYPSSDSSSYQELPQIKFNRDKCRLQILMPLGNVTSNFSSAAQRYFVPPKTPTFIEGYVWVENGLRDAELKAAAEKAAAEKLALERAAAEKLALERAAAERAATRTVTITCVKGKLTKRVIAVKPKCPAGYKLKK